MAGTIQTIHSVGIDIDTTTTQLIFSSLHIMNRAPVSQVPRYEFIDKTILYASEMYPTPLAADDSIDEAALRGIILKEYAQAGFRLAEIESGAIIITGETVKAGNARDVLLRLSEDLG